MCLHKNHAFGSRLFSDVTVFTLPSYTDGHLKSALTVRQPAEATTSYQLKRVILAHPLSTHWPRAGCEGRARRVPPLPPSLILQPLPGPSSCPQEPGGGKENRVGQKLRWPSPLSYRIVCVSALSMPLTSTVHVVGTFSWRGLNTLTGTETADTRAHFSLLSLTCVCKDLGGIPWLPSTV